MPSARARSTVRTAPTQVRIGVWRGTVGARRPEGHPDGRLETWSASRAVASRYGTDVTRADLTLDAALDLTGPSDGAQMGVDAVASAMGMEPTALLAWLAERRVPVRDYAADPDGMERVADADLDPHRTDLIVFDMADAPGCGDLLRAHGYDGIVHHGWEGEGEASVEYRAVDPVSIRPTGVFPGDRRRR